MTAHLFVQLQYFWESHDLKKDKLTADVEVYFLKQIIKSPYRMSLYQNINQVPELAIKFYDDDYYASHHGADFSGNIVLTYVQLILLAKEMKAQQHFLSHPKNKFKFIPSAIEKKW
jgi:hypothetical protein